MRSVALDHTIIPRRVTGSIADSRQWPSEAVGHSVTGEVGDEAEGIVVNDFRAKGTERGLDCSIRLLYNISPSCDTVCAGTAEVFSRDGGNMLWIDVCDENIWGTGVQESLDRSRNLG